MKRIDHTESFQNQTDQQSGAQAPATYRDLPNRPLTAFKSPSLSGATKRPCAARTCAVC
jgi:hypothetical protein